MRILVVDDDVFSRRLLAATLRKLGHLVTEVDDGKPAWQAYRDEPFPLIISDWMMPEVDGLELCRRIRAAGWTKYTYFILLTMKEGKESYLEGIGAGADDFIVKPFDQDVLAARLRVAERIINLQTALSGLLPICAWCKNIRDENGDWQAIETYVAQRSEAEFSHGICPSCKQRVIDNLPNSLK
jgi:phosphoserine phosphatase RsbU/P